MIGLKYVNNMSYASDNYMRESAMTTYSDKHYMNANSKRAKPLTYISYDDSFELYNILGYDDYILSRTGLSNKTNMTHSIYRIYKKLERATRHKYKLFIDDKNYR